MGTSRFALHSHYLHDMDATARNWSVSTDHGLSLDADELVGLLGVHHQRLLDTWQGFAPAHEPRNSPRAILRGAALNVCVR